MRRLVLLALGLILASLLGCTAESSLARRAQAIQATAENETAAAKHNATDSWITLKTKLALLADEGLSGLDVSVGTRHRVVTLRGKVDSEDARQALERAAHGIAGHTKVIDDLVVVPGAERPVVDWEDVRIVRDVKQSLQADASLEGGKIAVRADRGIVTLIGRASSLETSVQAFEDARRVPGVRAVHNDLSLEYRG